MSFDNTIDHPEILALKPDVTNLIWLTAAWLIKHPFAYDCRSNVSDRVKEHVSYFLTELCENLRSTVPEPLEQVFLAQKLVRADMRALRANSVLGPICYWFRETNRVSNSTSIQQAEQELDNAFGILHSHVWSDPDLQAWWQSATQRREEQ